ncbi:MULTISPECIES: DUF4349 domain-containing protein [unclassified Pseudomonas]|uniref:DUF4349 domain-containing protein n=1 Tax=unclassified Pseudomonas TaxID=196821 RepID=UPI002446E954|nr:MULTISPECIES: DUF4349 domain-containing protein [unclassified Pseudomonas]MDG9928480.1 DUF4349 domain-containing protein [Pseudomonas sp. GD04042]MDH0482650.1 DUF4349 domain-containing protein [Pseudomonas sp. GD04015]MDH0604648.1 DUF4349 domain-containing protein [Pseudomonas sp. GD03869]
MNTPVTRWGAVVLALCLTLLGGCSNKSFESPSAAAEPASAPVEQVSPVGRPEGRLLAWSADLSVEVADVDKTVAELNARIVALGGYVEEKSDYRGLNYNLVYRVPDKLFDGTVSEIEQSGKVLSRSVKGKDVTEQYVDLDTRLKTNLALRDRFRDLLGKARDVKDILQIETELNRVQTEIDAMEARMRILNDQIHMSVIRLTLLQQTPPQPPTIYGPLGYLYKGVEWVVVKLFVIRE